MIIKAINCLWRYYEKHTMQNLGFFSDTIAHWSCRQMFGVWYRHCSAGVDIIIIVPADQYDWKSVQPATSGLVVGVAFYL
jgi:hypothetical protein